MNFVEQKFREINCNNEKIHKIIVFTTFFTQPKLNPVKGRGHNFFLNRGH